MYVYHKFTDNNRASTFCVSNEIYEEANATPQVGI